MSSMINDTIDKGLFNDLMSAFLGPHAASSDMARYATYASAAVAGGALYYYLNTQGPQPVRLIDYKKQTCEIPVSETCFFYLTLLLYYHITGTS